MLNNLEMNNLNNVNTDNLDVVDEFLTLVEMYKKLNYSCKYFDGAERPQMGKPDNMRFFQFGEKRAATVSLYKNNKTVVVCNCC